MPAGVKSNTQARIMASGNPAITSVTVRRGSHSGAPRSGNTVAATWIRTQPPTAYTPATRPTWRRCNSPMILRKSMTLRAQVHLIPNVVICLDRKRRSFVARPSAVRHFPAMQTRPTYDAVIVGSGAGGGMAAYMLTRAGANVVMLEAGPSWYATEDSPMFTWNWQSPRRGASTP